MLQETWCYSSDSIARTSIIRNLYYSDVHRRGRTGSAPYKLDSIIRNLDDSDSKWTNVSELSSDYCICLNHSTGTRRREVVAGNPEARTSSPSAHAPDSNPRYFYLKLHQLRQNESNVAGESKHIKLSTMLPCARCAVLYHKPIGVKRMGKKLQRREA